MTECIFCGGACTCSTGAPAARKKKASKPARKALTRAPALATGTSTKAPVLKKESAALNTELTPDELDYRDCIRVLAPILNHDDLHKVSHILDAEPTLEEKLYSFKKERAVEQERIDEASRVG